MSSVFEPGDEYDPTDDGLWAHGEPAEEKGLAVVEAQARDLADRNIEVGFTAAQKELIKAINPEATTAQLQVFMYQAARTGLDPIAKQIYLVTRDGKMAIQTGIDGFRLVGHRTGQIAGVDEPVFTEDERGNLVKASVTIWKIAADGQRYPYTAVAYWDEYAPPNLDAPSAFMWKKMRHTMLGKCAEALAWRKACPAELSGVYTDDEMGQADFTTLGRRAETPVVTSEYNCPKCLEHGKVVKVIDNRKAAAESTKEKKPPSWKCSAQSKCGDGKGKWGWGSWDPHEFDERETGGTTIEVTTYPSAEPSRAELEEAWDAADPNRPFTPDDQAAPPTQPTLPTASVAAVVERLSVSGDEAKRKEAEFIKGLDATEVDRFSQLMALIQVAPTSGSNDALRARMESICRLMFEEGIWPEDALARMLTTWPRVPSWEALARSGKQAVIAFTTALVDKAQKDVKNALDKEPTR